MRLYTTQHCEVPHKLYINMCMCMGFSLEPCALSLIWTMQQSLGTAHCSWSCQVCIRCVIVCWHITERWQPGSPRDQVHTKLSCTLLVWCSISTFCGAVSVHSVVQYQYILWCSISLTSQAQPIPGLVSSCCYQHLLHRTVVLVDTKLLSWIHVKILGLAWIPTKDLNTSQMIWLLGLWDCTRWWLQ